MKKKPKYSMPDTVDRTDIARVRAMRDRDIDYSDIPPLSDPVWMRGEGPKAVRIHVTPSPDGGWEVRLSGARRAQGLFHTQSEAVSVARRRARGEKGELVVHSRSGDVRTYHNYAA
jgi:Uncharacterized protein conserved in bacteria (DUF2188)